MPMLESVSSQLPVTPMAASLWNIYVRWVVGGCCWLDSKGFSFAVSTVKRQGRLRPHYYAASSEAQDTDHQGTTRGQSPRHYSCEGA